MKAKGREDKRQDSSMVTWEGEPLKRGVEGSMPRPLDFLS